MTEREADKKLLEEECGHLLAEIERLQKNMEMQGDRWENLSHLVNMNLPRRTRILTLATQIYTSINIEDSKAMKRLSYIAMIYLPAAFMSIRQLSLL